LRCRKNRRFGRVVGAAGQGEVSVFALSTVDTDYLLVSDKQLHAAIAALKGAGHRVEESGAAS
jgi:hypothetical protein